MEGIAHRHDCPASAGAPPSVEVTRRIRPGYVLTELRCRDCGRAAHIRRPAAPEVEPK